jgi:Trehalose synthase, N-terminal domain
MLRSAARNRVFSIEQNDNHVRNDSRRPNLHARSSSLEEYEPFIGAAAIERILKKAETLRTLHLVHISSTFYGGGVTEILTPLTLTLNAMGIETGWRMLQGTPAFFACTKKLHNTLQGETVGISEADKAIYEQVVFENATRLHSRIAMRSSFTTLSRGLSCSRPKTRIWLMHCSAARPLCCRNPHAKDSA